MWHNIGVRAKNFTLSKVETYNFKKKLTEKGPLNVKNL